MQPRLVKPSRPENLNEDELDGGSANTRVPFDQHRVGEQRNYFARANRNKGMRASNVTVCAEIDHLHPIPNTSGTSHRGA